MNTVSRKEELTVSHISESLGQMETETVTIRFYDTEVKRSFQEIAGVKDRLGWTW